MKKMRNKSNWIWTQVWFPITCFFVAALITGLVVESMSFTGLEQNLEIIDVDVTAYSPSPNITDDDPFTMASGRRARPTELEQLRFVAVSRDLMEEYGLEYGDTIWIGFTVEDTMHPRIKDTVDLFMRNLDLARRFGRQKRQIIIRRRE